MDFFVKILVWGGVNKWKWMVFFSKITNLLDTTSDNVPRFITKKWIEVHDQSFRAEGRYKPSKQIRLKT